MHVTGQFLINLVYFKPLQNRVTDGNGPVVGWEKTYVCTRSPSTADRSDRGTWRGFRRSYFSAFGLKSVILIPLSYVFQIFISCIKKNPPKYDIFFVVNTAQRRHLELSYMKRTF